MVLQAQVLPVLGATATTAPTTAPTAPAIFVRLGAAATVDGTAAILARRMYVASSLRFFWYLVSGNLESAFG